MTTSAAPRHAPHQPPAPAVSSEQIDELARTIDGHGIGAIARDVLSNMAMAALRAGASPVLVEVLVDPQESDVVRNRAFGRVAMQLANRSGDTRFVLAA